MSIVFFDDLCSLGECDGVVFIDCFLVYYILLCINVFRVVVLVVNVVSVFLYIKGKNWFVMYGNYIY